MLETIWPFGVIVLLLLFLGNVSMNTLSSVRAFVTGESFWSKSQKEAVYHLNQYAKTHEDAEYRQFESLIAVTLHDKAARLELVKSRPDITKAANHLIKGKNDPADVYGMTQLFLLFHNTSLMKPSIGYWEQGDLMVNEMIALARQLNSKIQAGNTKPQDIEPILHRINDINLELTPLQDAFSNALGEASRKAQLLITGFMFVFTLVLMWLGILFTRKMVVRNVNASNALRISEERWKFALDGARDGVWDWDLKTNEVMVSRQWKTMLGYEEHELEANYLEWEQRVHPDDLAKVLRALRNYVNGKSKKYSIEHRMQCKDGHYKWILTRGMTVATNVKGRPERIVGTHTDIDELKNVEASLRESDTNQRALLDAMVDGVFVAQDKKFVFANPILPVMLGYQPQEFIGIPFDKVVAPESLTIWTKRFIARVGDGVEPVKNYQVKFLMKGGEETIWLDLHASRVMYRGKRGVLGILRDISKQKEAEDMIWHQANYDTLSGLPNRRMFRDRVEQEIKKFERTEASLAIMFLDLDHFKEVNDTMGHDVGDRLLIEAAIRLKSCIRDSDTVARLGGDEFVLMLTEIQDITGLERIAQSILARLAEPFVLGDNEPIYMSGSIGITLFPLDAQDFDNLLKNADQAMYAAKSSGRNRYSYFTPSMQEAAQSKMRLANDLRHAIERNELRLVYQPIVDTVTREIRKAEALLRWQHPVHGFVSPAEFIPVAEETGLIHEIGEWVFHTAVNQVSAWHKNLHPEFQVSINKSPVQFRTSQSSWLQYLEDIEMSPSSVVIEITESLLLDATDSVAKRLSTFKQAGMQVAIDDFGTGYSSLSYLKKFDIDYIKIDQSFVRNMTHNSSDMHLCEAIILMAHKLEMKVIAEGVETDVQYRLLADAGCDFMQGYLLSKPLAPADFERLISESWTVPN